MSKKPYRSDRVMAWRNMMVAAINDGLAHNVFDLGATEPAKADRPQSSFELAGLPAIAHFAGISHDEIRVNVIVAPTPAGYRCIYSGILGGFFQLGDAFASGWLERRTGKWLQLVKGGRELFRCRRHLVPRLAALKIEPQGYRDHGKFFL
jgi:hypothetical protein